ncbi:hypothetical protein [Streptomyces cinereoruber]|uniref:hypothetical protein n=1 Tax=Streptomyces cinereoruber TaxID=67260 RepID=UPI00362BD02F
MGDLAMVADGQWGVGVQPGSWPAEDTVVAHRVADGQRVELTVEELARAVGAGTEDVHRDEDLA